MRRILRGLVALLAVTLGIGGVAFKVWLEATGPYLEALPVHDLCGDAEEALAAQHVDEALELAEAGDCAATSARARALLADFPSSLTRCADGVWTGRGDDTASVSCAIASDLVVFGDVRDLARQTVRWSRGEATDPLLVALSSAGLVLTFAPAAGAGTALLKVARRSGALTRGLAEGVTVLVRQRAWRPLGAMLGDAGRIARKLGPTRGSRALAHADTPAELATLARFVDEAPHPLLGLRWGGKTVARLDAAVYRIALARGPDGVALATRRGAAALLSRKPFVVFAAKAIYGHPEAIARFALGFATWLLRWLSWPIVLAAAALLIGGGALAYPRRRYGRGRRGRAGLDRGGER